MLRREEMYIDPKTEEEKDMLLNSGQDEGTMNAIFAKFYGMIIYYLNFVYVKIIRMYSFSYFFRHFYLQMMRATTL